MTIGRFGHDYSTGPNPDFVCLLDCHKNVCSAFNLSPADVQISMGMSDDFEQAVSWSEKKLIIEQLFRMTVMWTKSWTIFGFSFKRFHLKLITSNCLKLTYIWVTLFWNSGLIWAINIALTFFY